MKIIAVLAMTDSLLIGAKNGLPWHLPEDMKHFRDITKWWIVIMGKTTYFSLPDAFRPLPGRRNIVLSRSLLEWVETFSDIRAMLEVLQNEWVERIFVIGGASVYDQFFEQDLVDEVELTLVEGQQYGDIFVQEFRNRFTRVAEKKSEGCTFYTLNHI